MPPLNLFTRAPALSTNVCTTATCVAVSDYILSRVNLTVDPCSDFYQYTCGSWINSPAIKEGYEEGQLMLNINDVQLENGKRVKKILDGSYEDFKHNLKSNATGFHLDDQGDMDRANFEFIQSYYNVCQDVNLYQSNKFTPIFEDIVMLQNQIVPLNTTASQYGRAFAFFTQQSIGILPFQLDLTISALNHDTNEVIIKNNPELAGISYNREFVFSQISRVVGQPNKTDPNAQMIIEASQKSGFEFWSNSTISAAVDNHERIVNRISNIINGTDTDPTSNVTLLTGDEWMSFEAVQQALPQINISVLLTTLSEGLDPNAATSIHFRAFPTFLEEVNAMFSNETEKSLQDFFTVQFIAEKYKYLAPSETITQLFEDNSLHLNATELNTTISSIQSDCASDTGASFVYGLSRYYGLETFGDENDRQKTIKFVEMLRESLIQRISNNSWLDNQTKQLAMQKIQQIQAYVAYSETNPDWRDPASIKRYYGNQTIDTRSYYHAKKAALYDSSRRKWQNIATKSTATIWSNLESPTMLNAFYDPLGNQIAMLLGIMQKPMYNTEFPEYINFGNLGAIVGHELVHALDSQGRLFNATGYREDWWTPQATKQYEERQQCFVEDYSKIFIPGEEGSKIYVDGEQTLGENIADAGGLNTAFNAYRNYVAKERQGIPELPLPGLESLTAEQMFYVSFSLFHCESIPPSQATRYETDVHAPFFARTNPVIINNEDFATVFNCPAGSPMNKKKDSEKCHLW